MPTYDLPFGKRLISVEIPTGMTAEVIVPDEILPSGNPKGLVANAIEHPVDGIVLDVFKGLKSVAIAVNDKTRPVPHQFLLPPLLSKLEVLGFIPEQIKFLVATGTHPPMTPDDCDLILPAEVTRNYEVISHNCDDLENLANLGHSSIGTPIYINRVFIDADLRIVIGNIEPHHFAGFSGGVKTAVIGLAGRQTINHNHKMLLQPGSRVAEYFNNPTRQDIEEIGKIVNIQFALNAILNQNRDILYGLSGSPKCVMEKGVELAKQVCITPVKRRYDLVVASPGGYPKDINLYQSQKALSQGALITRDGGTVILVAECVDGVGSEDFERFMTDVESLSEIYEKMDRTGFSVGPHKAVQFARELERINVILVSNIMHEKVRKLLLTPADNLDDALRIARALHPACDRMAILPKAINTIPLLSE